MNTAASGQGGLRERKKEQTRAALSWAAIRLTVQKGWDNVRVEDIAADVGVSSRTFNNYFSSKGEAVAARHLDRIRGIGAALRERPEGEPLWDSITAAVLSQVPPARDGEGKSTLDEEWIEGVRLMTSEPALQGDLLRAGAVGSTEVAAAVADRTGTDAERDMYPRLVAGAVGAVIPIATTQWLNVDTTTPVHSLLREALRQLTAGLPVPE